MTKRERWREYAIQRIWWTPFIKAHGRTPEHYGELLAWVEQQVESRPTETDPSMPVQDTGRDAGPGAGGRAGEQATGQAPSSGTPKPEAVRRAASDTIPP